MQATLMKSSDISSKDQSTLGVLEAKKQKILYMIFLIIAVLGTIGFFIGAIIQSTKNDSTTSSCTGDGNCNSKNEGNCVNSPSCMWNESTEDYKVGMVVLWILFIVFLIISIVLGVQINILQAEINDPSLARTAYATGLTQRQGNSLGTSALALGGLGILGADILERA
tara:strand:+ start:184 stop:687 length:504 start_codon:yes stop_codon:yes gene_type:complete